MVSMDEKDLEMYRADYEKEIFSFCHLFVHAIMFSLKLMGWCILIMTEGLAKSLRFLRCSLDKSGFWNTGLEEGFAG